MVGFSSIQLGRTVPSKVEVLADTDSLAWKVLTDKDSLAYAWKISWVVIWWHQNKGLEQAYVALLSKACTVHSRKLDDNGFVEYSLYVRTRKLTWQCLAIATRCVQP
jgi:hypothetical protein